MREINYGAVLDGQIARVDILKEKKVLWINYVLITYTENLYDGAVFLYKTQKVKWIRKSELIEFCQSKGEK